MLFKIFNSKYECVSSRLTKHQVYYAFIEKKLNKDGGFFIQDEEGLDMKFNEFEQFYPL